MFRNTKDVSGPLRLIDSNTPENEVGACASVTARTDPGKILLGCRREKRVEMMACFSGLGSVLWMCSIMPFPLRRDGVAGVSGSGGRIATLEKG